MQEIAFQSISNQTFSERGIPPDSPGGVNPLFKNILDPLLDQELMVSRLDWIVQSLSLDTRFVSRFTSA